MLHTSVVNFILFFPHRYFTPLPLVSMNTLNTMKGGNSSPANLKYMHNCKYLHKHKIEYITYQMSLLEKHFYEIKNFATENSTD